MLWEPIPSGLIKEGEMLAPRPTRGGNEKPERQLVWNEPC